MKALTRWVKRLLRRLGLLRQSVVIVGFSGKTFHYCKLFKADEMWTLNHAELAEDLPRIDALFEIHKRDWYLRKESVKSPQYKEYLAKHHPFPIYTQKEEANKELVPSAVPYPYEAIKKKYLSGLIETNSDLEEHALTYFTATIAFMFAMAMYEGFKTIYLAGIDMSLATEYSWQRPCAEFWLGMARGKGIRVVIPEETILCKAPVYGYEIVPYIDHDIVGDMQRHYDRKADEYLPLVQEKANQLAEDPENQAVLDDYLKTSAQLYMYMGAASASSILLKESDRYISRHWIEAKKVEYINGIDKAKGEYNVLRTKHDMLLAEGKNDPELWDKVTSARATMFANEGALQLHNQLIRIIDMRPFKKDMVLEISEEVEVEKK